GEKAATSTRAQNGATRIILFHASHVGIYRLADRINEMDDARNVKEVHSQSRTGDDGMDIQWASGTETRSWWTQPASTRPGSCWQEVRNQPVLTSRSPLSRGRRAAGRRQIDLFRN